MNNNKTLVALALLTLGVSSCKDKDIEFNKADYDASLKAAFPVQDIDLTHTWATMGTAKVYATVNLTNYAVGETFTYNIYAENPLTNSQVTLLATGTVTNGGNLSATVNYQLASTDIFIALVDTQGHMTVYPRSLSEGSLSTSIGGQTAAAQAGAAKPEELQETAASRRVVKNNVTFPDEPQASSYKTTNEATTQCGEYTEGSKLYIDASNTGTKVQARTSGVEVYVVGEVHPSSISFPNQAKVYVLPGATLIVNDGFEFGQGQNEVYVAAGGVLKAVDSNGNLAAFSMGSSGKLYNKGTVNCTTLKTQGTSWIYNQGTINATLVDLTTGDDRLVNAGTINSTNMGCNGATLNLGTLTLTQHLRTTANTSYFENDGTFTAVNHVMGGVAKVYNYNSVTLSGSLLTSSNSEVWDNQGTYICKSFRRTGGWSDMIINRCKLICTDSMEVSGSGTAAFRNEGYVQTPYLYLTTSRITLASSSVFKVTDKAHFGYNNYNPWYMAGSLGFQSVATESSKALLILKKATRDTQQASFNISYWGPMVVACPDHFDANTGFTSNDGDPTHPQACFRDGALFTADVANTTVVIPTTQCVEGHNGQNVPAPSSSNTTLSSFRYCFEDNFPSPGDYDFNDVVLTLTPSVSGQVMTLDVSLDAVGATACLAAGIRLVGAASATPAAVTSFSNPPSELGTYREELDNQFVTKGSDKIVVLFKDAHYAINPGSDNNGVIPRPFYNTVKDRNNEKGQVVSKKTARYTFTFPSAEQAQAAVAENCFDVFLINPAGYEIHTVQNGFKLAQALIDRQNFDAYVAAYGNAYTWGIMVPGTFKYPIEWTPIGGNKGYVATGAYQTTGHSFAAWATDQTQATDWYKYPDSSLVYE